MALTYDERTCPECGKHFRVTPPSRAKKYCCRDCEFAHKEKRSHITLVCENCGETFEARRCDGDRKYCSRQCAGEANRGTKMATNVCPQCGEEYEVVASRAKRRKYCSKECAYDARRHGPKLPTERTCEWCGSVFSAGASSDQRFCSRECASAKLKDDHRDERSCERCGETFVVTTGDDKRFCSIPCANNFNGKERREDRPSQDNTLRNSFVVVDNGKTKSVARVLLEEETGSELPKGSHVHHIDCDYTHNVVDNLWVFSGTSEHLKAHRSLDGCVKPLLEKNVIVFDGDNGIYSVNYSALDAMDTLMDLDFLRFDKETGEYYVPI